jgi:hypothetical protein
LASLSCLLLRSTQWGAEKFMGKLRGEKDIQAMIQRLDRLTLDKGQATAQTLEVVYGLVQHRLAIMNGENFAYPVLPSLPAECPYA